MKAAFYTLGCKVNQNETSAMEELFRQAGFQLVSPDEVADVYLVNSCTVTAGGDAKSRQWLRRVRRQNPQAVTVLTGCFPQAFPEKATIPEADIVTGTGQRAALPALVLQFMQDRTPLIAVTPHQKGQGFEELPLATIAGRTRAFVKIQDGCNRRCAYCIIPTARGPARSRPEESILSELERLAGAGFAEVVFTGINLSSYGRETGTDLGALVTNASAISGLRRLRLSSLEPDLVPDSQIDVFAASRKLCPHFHLSLQSGCDDTLRRMRRPYTTTSYRQVAEKLRTAMPGAGLTTDIIVGFPGENEEEFLQSLRFVAEMAFLKVHVFPFSARPGTPAASFEGQLPKQEKAERVARMQQAADAARQGWVLEQMALPHEVLLETPLENGHFNGYTKNYIPVEVTAQEARQGQIVTVQLTSYDGHRCLGHSIG